MTRDRLFQKLEILLVIASLVLMVMMITQPASAPRTTHPAGGAVAPITHRTPRVYAC